MSVTNARLQRLEKETMGSKMMYVVKAPVNDDGIKPVIGFSARDFLLSLGHEVGPNDLVVTLNSFNEPGQPPKLISAKVIS